MNYSEKISIVVPAFNVEKYIRKCLESIVSQTYKNIEIIIVNDGSVDRTGDICEEFKRNDSRIIVIHQVNKGVVCARKEGIRRAQGKYICFLDGDDWIERQMLDVYVSQIEDADVLCAGVYRGEEGGKENLTVDKVREGKYEKTHIGEILVKSLYDLEKNIVHPMTPWLFNKMYKTEKVKEIYSLLNDKLVYAEDLVFVFLYYLNSKCIKVSHDAFYHYQYREDSVVHKKNVNLLKHINDSYNELHKLFMNQPKEYELLYQLDKWLVTATNMALKRSMGLDERICIPEFIAHINAKKNDRIVLYGAGTMGKDIKIQLERENYQDVIWVDENFQMYQNLGLNVYSPERIVPSECDYVYIAIENTVICNSVRDYLIKKGIDAFKINFNDAYKLF